uniref:microsomal epoxide hydrolase n=1 Tax=Cacopsylla melanoneura TaxID=428564 RepID=A0A8D8UQM9_9HEMI
MGLCKWILISLLIGIVYIGFEIMKVPPLPHLPDTHWGKGQPRPDDVGIYPFTVNVSDSVLNDLKSRIRSTNTLTPPLEGVGFEYGFNSDYLKVVLDYWANNYNWRKFETALNKFPQFKTQISGLNIHFIRVTPKVPAQVKIVPLLILHGWPGSVKEFQRIIPMLTEPRKEHNFVFEVIAPSLPGYGWSEAAVRPGLGAAQMGLLMKKLMARLGYPQFYVQGGDWGAFIAANMATLFPENVKGLHSNMCVAHTTLATLKLFIGSLYPPLVVEEKYAHRMYPLSKNFDNMMLESGYYHLQSTKPDTVGVGLLDSPAGLAAYILEKFLTWSDPKSFSFLKVNEPSSKQGQGQVQLGDISKLDDALDDVTIYWVTRTIQSSVRMYAETQNKTQTGLGLMRIPTHVPTACICFPHELAYQSHFMLKEKFPRLIQMTHPTRGGHFAALEEPKILADDVWTFVEKVKELEKQEEELRKIEEEIRREEEKRTRRENEEL